MSAKGLAAPDDAVRKHEEELAALYEVSGKLTGNDNQEVGTLAGIWQTVQGKGRSGGDSLEFPRGWLWSCLGGADGL